MKKLFLLITVIATLLLTSCATDNIPAIAEITSSTGQAFTCLSHHGIPTANSTGNKVVFHVPEGESITVHFFCTECGYDELTTLNVPASKVFLCDCEHEVEKDEEDNTIVIENEVLIIEVQKKIMESGNKQVAIGNEQSESESEQLESETEMPT